MQLFRSISAANRERHAPDPRDPPILLCVVGTQPSCHRRDQVGGLVGMLVNDRFPFRHRSCRVEDLAGKVSHCGWR